MNDDSEPTLRPQTRSLLSFLPNFSETQQLVTIFLERVNPHAWVFPDDEMLSIVDKLYKDSSQAHIWELCSLLLTLGVATHFQTSAATANIAADSNWQHAILAYLDEILSRASQNPLWASRIFVLLTLNGMGARKNSCWHFHGKSGGLCQVVIMAGPS